MTRMDEYILSADRNQFRNSYDNADRIHLRITLSRGADTIVGISTLPARTEAENLALLQQLAGVLGWRLTKVHAGNWHDSNIMSGYLNAHPILKGEVCQARINLGGVLNVLRQEGIDKVEVRIRAFASPTLRLIPHDPRWVRTTYGGRPVYAGVFQTHELVLPIIARYGFTSYDKVRGWTYFFAILLIPTSLFLFMRSWTLRSPGAYPAFKRVRSFLLWATLFFWLFGLIEGGIGNVLFRAVPAPGAAIRPIFIAVLMMSWPMLFSIAVGCLSLGLDRRFIVGEAQFKFHLIRSIYAPASLGVMALLIGLGMSLAPDRLSRLMDGPSGQTGLRSLALTPLVLLLLTSSIVMRVVLKRMLNPQPLENGELFDRIFLLAKQAGVTVSGVFICHTGRRKIANALVNHSGAVYLTDHLLSNFMSGEIDAVVAHEIGHLQSNHLAKRLVAVVGGGISCVVVSGIVAMAVGLSFWMWLVLGSIGLMALIGVVCRRLEFEADARAVALTRDPITYIGMLKQLHSLNSKSPIAERLLTVLGTHPSWEHRIGRIQAMSDAFPLPTAAPVA